MEPRKLSARCSAYANYNKFRHVNRHARKKTIAADICERLARLPYRRDICSFCLRNTFPGLVNWHKGNEITFSRKDALLLSLLAFAVIFFLLGIDDTLHANVANIHLLASSHCPLSYVCLGDQQVMSHCIAVLSSHPSGYCVIRHLFRTRLRTPIFFFSCARGRRIS